MKAWEDFLSNLETELGTQTVAQWLRPIKVVRFDAANLYLEATLFQRSWFEEQLGSRIAHLTNNNQRPIKIHWITTNPPKKDGPPNSSLIVSDTLDKEYRIENFYVSDSNLVAFKMAQEIIQSDRCTFNPVFFSGPPGCGKTHLLTALANALQGLGKTVFFVNAESFTEHVVQAIRQGRMLEFRKIYREIDVLIVDDIHLLARRNATQEEFFHTFNDLHTQQRQIILGARDIPSRLPDIEPRLISRFEWGLSLQLHSPDPTIFRKILQDRSHLLDMNPPEELFDFLLNHFSNHSNALLEALHAIALRSPQNFDLGHIRHVLEDLLQKESNSIVTPEKIIEQTATRFGIRPEDLTGSSQMREYVQPRQIAMFLCRTALQMPFQEIGRMFNRDHSTVMSSVKHIKTALENKEPKLANSTYEIAQKLGCIRMLNRAQTSFKS